MKTNSEQPATSAEANDSRTASDKAVVCKELLGRVLVACEYSGVVRDAFAALGWDAWSCDLLPSETPGNHIQGDVLEILDDGWDMMIAHPPCTFLSNSGARWLFEKEGRWKQLDDGCDFFKKLLNAPIKYIAVENPWPHKWAMQRIGKKPCCKVQPHEFGDKQKKKTCLWLKNLPPLMPTTYYQVPPSGSEESKAWEMVWRMPPGKNQAHERARTFAGIAGAMANQWTLATRPNAKLTALPDDQSKPPTT